MVDWNEVLKSIAEMQDYYVGCMNHAAIGSDARHKFAEYIGVLVCVADLIRERMGEEDDGK